MQSQLEGGPGSRQETPAEANHDLHGRPVPGVRAQSGTIRVATARRPGSQSAERGRIGCNGQSWAERAGTGHRSLWPENDSDWTRMHEAQRDTCSVNGKRD